MSATIDPAGTHGGPLLHTNIGGARASSAGRRCPSPAAQGRELEGLHRPGRRHLRQRAHLLQAVLGRAPSWRPRGLVPTFPADFLDDVAHDKLPQVSWLLTGIGDTEHPRLLDGGRRARCVARQIIEALMGNPKVWRRTALFITWDENGGFFDHVAPPAPKPGTTGEYLTGTLPARRRGHPRADRARRPGADARRLAVLARWSRVPGHASITPRRCASSRPASAPRCRT